MCRFDMPPSRTNNKRGEQTIRIKTTRAEKKGFTVALACSNSNREETTSCDSVQETGRITGGAYSTEPSHPIQCTRESNNKWLDDSGGISALADTRLREGVSSSLANC